MCLLKHELEPKIGDLVTSSEPSLYLYDSNMMWRGQVALVVGENSNGLIKILLFKGKVSSAVGYGVLRTVG